MNTNLQKIAIRMSKYAIYAFIGCHSLLLAFATESDAQRKYLAEITIQFIESRNNLELLDLISELESKTNFQFAYSKHQLKDITISLTEGNWNMNELLTSISIQGRLSIKRVNETIALYPVEKIEKLPQISDAINVEMTVSGRVTDENGDPLPGATILEKGTSNGTITDIDGSYNISVQSPEAILLVSFVGYTTKEVEVAGRSSLDISMVIDLANLEEVVVVGYGTQKKSHLTGAVAKVTNKNLDQMPVNNIDQTLAGKLAGVQVSNTDAEAGASQKIQVRGISSINAGTGPLIVVDGYPLPTSDLSVVDPNTVESIEVLKDAASTAIYGSRGANGVIMITTKRGEVGQSKFSFKSQVGVKSLYPHERIFSTPTEWANYVGNHMEEMGLSETPAEITEMLNLGTYSDWQDIATQNGVIQNYTLSAMGGTQKMKYYVAGTYLSDQGVFLENDYKKYSLRLNLDLTPSENLDLGFQINPTYVDQSDVALRFHDALRGAPWLPIYHNETTVEYAHASGYPDVQVGDYAHELHFSDVNGTVLANSGNNNTYASIKEVDINRNFLNTYSNAYLTYRFLDGFSIRSSVGAFTRIYERNYFRKKEGHRTGDIIGQYQNQKTLNFLNENILGYKKTYGNHNLDVLAGFTMQQWISSVKVFDSNGYLTDDIPTMNAAANVSVNKSATGDTKESLLSTLFRINYDFRSKYLVSLTTRWDGSSRFGANNKWGYFPSASIGWRMSEENFLIENNTISNLKVRASYGVTGNNGINNYESVATLSPANAILGGQTVQGLAQSSPGNPDISWERTFSLNTGVDLGLLKDRLNFSFNYYKSVTDQLLLLKQIPTSTGFSQVRVNQGKLQNQGLELEMSTINIDRRGFRWKTDFNISGNRNKVLNFGGVDEIISTPDIKRPSQFITRPGEPLVQYYGYVSADELPLNTLASPYWPIDVGHEKIYVKDLNGDGVIDQDDRTVLGNPYPDFIWGMTNAFSYKNLELSFVFQGSQGAEIYNIDEYYFKTLWKGLNTLDDAEQAKTKGKLETDVNVQDASFIALRNLNIGYEVPKGLTKTFVVKFYLSAQNLWFKFADDYISFNPEGVNDFTDNPLTYGYQRGATPFARTYSLGLNVTF